ncbi:hypothetical protein EGH82_15900 [Vibrio ponticus]|uniref:Uncharacterized protein n=1 Tax=Vibrio ponticus TaxID=265668 RepID=A0A3N3DWQ2_9VIBR|nr:hypothetical protein [Vibrio ponticus]ROV58964.1 hypothetical protein EGH82_15900 [Vibrio ponticus]
MKRNTCSYRNIIRASGIYDIIMMLPFAIPGVSGVVIDLIYQAHYGFELAGTVPSFSPFHLMFVNLMASISIVWAVIRVANPIALYAWYDTATRVVIALLMLVYLFGYGVTPMIWLFVVAEIAWAVLQINGYLYKNNDTSSNPRAIC